MAKNKELEFERLCLRVDARPAEWRSASESRGELRLDGEESAEA